MAPRPPGSALSLSPAFLAAGKKTALRERSAAQGRQCRRAAGPPLASARPSAGGESRRGNPLPQQHPTGFTFVNYKLWSLHGPEVPQTVRPAFASFGADRALRGCPLAAKGAPSAERSRASPLSVRWNWGRAQATCAGSRRAPGRVALP